LRSGNLGRPKINPTNLIELFLRSGNLGRPKINPTNLIELFLRSENLGRPKINPTNLIGQINPTKLVGFKKSSQNSATKKPYLFDRTYSAFCAFSAE
jgi:hypothetical protein